MNKLEIPRNEYRMSIISSCNMKCVYCHNEGNTQVSMLKVEDIEKIIKDSKKYELKGVRLTGGEPLVHPQIFEICQMISEKYNLRVSVNTNCIEIEKLVQLIKNNWIDRVVVGLDYFDNDISKNSPIGVSSKQILDNILKIRKLGCDVSISSVYNNDLQNKVNMVDWGIENGVRVKILEIVKNEIAKSTSEEFLNMEKEIGNIFKLDYKKDKYNEISGYKENKKVVTYFHSHCRIRECDICKKIHLRITADGKMKQCMYYHEDDINTKSSDFSEKLKKYIEQPAKFY